MSATPPFAALPTAPGLARGHVRATLAEWGLGEFADTAELIASEMTANAVNASAPVLATGTVLVILLCLVTHGHVLTIECWDQAPGIPALQEASGFAETGRGLAIIDSLSGGAWGCRPAIGQAGKCVWVEISLRDLPASQLLALLRRPQRDRRPSANPPRHQLNTSIPVLNSQYYERAGHLADALPQPAVCADGGRSEPHELPGGEQISAMDAAIIPEVTGYGATDTVRVSEEVLCSAHS